MAAGVTALAVVLPGVALSPKFGAGALLSWDVQFFMGLCAALLAAITWRDGAVLRPVMRAAIGTSALVSATVAGLLMHGPVKLLAWTTLHAVVLSSILACVLPAAAGAAVGMAQRHVLALRGHLPLMGWVSASLPLSLWLAAGTVAWLRP